VEDAALKAIYALYPDPHSAQQTVNDLRSTGISDRDIVVISSEPFEEYEFSHRDGATWLYWIAGFGGTVGLCVAYWLARATEERWPLPTGGMPIVAMWPNLIVMFELTMLGGILATVIALLVTTRLLRRQPPLYDPEVSEGKILVGIENPAAASIAQIERALGGSGVGRLKTVS